MANIFRIGLAVVILLASSPINSTQINNPDLPASVEVLKSTDDGIKIKVTAPGYLLQSETINAKLFDQLSVQGAEVNAKPGTPEIPVLSVLVGVPAAADISLYILSDQVLRIPGTYSLAPAPVPVGIGEDLKPGKFDHIPNEDIYNTDAPYPESPVQIEDDGWLRDQRIIRIAFYPFQYNPAKGEIIWYQEIQVSVDFNTNNIQVGSTGSVLDTTRGDEYRNQTNSPFETFLQDELLNYDTAQSWRLTKQSFSDQISAYPELQSEGIKITVNEDGLYKITYSDLITAGMELEDININPTNFHLTNQGQDVGILISGNEDDVFESGESIIFYGQYFRGDRMAQIYADEDHNWLNQFTFFSDGSTINWDAQLNATMFEKYTEENVYWLSVEEKSRSSNARNRWHTGNCRNTYFFPGDYSPGRIPRMVDLAFYRGRYLVLANIKTKHLD